MSSPTCTLELKVIPNAPRSEVAGWLGPVMKVKIHAPALQDRANVELLGFLAGKLGLPLRNITLVRGAKSRLKLVRVAGLDATAVRARLAPAFPDPPKTGKPAGP